MAIQICITRFDQRSRGHPNCLIFPFSPSSVCSAFCFSKNTWLSAIASFGCVAPNAQKPTADCLKKVSSLNYGKSGKLQQWAVDIKVESQLPERLFHLKTLCQLSNPKVVANTQVGQSPRKLKTAAAQEAIVCRGAYAWEAPPRNQGCSWPE